MDSITTRLQKKHPESKILDFGTFAFVTTETNEFHYQVDAAGRLRLAKTRALTVTEISVNKQPYDHVIMLTGDGPYKGQYYKQGQCDGWLIVTSDIKEAHVMREYSARQHASHLAFDSQYCYGQKFTAVRIDQVANPQAK
jgi:hypothetical protein